MDDPAKSLNHISPIEAPTQKLRTLQVRVVWQGVPIKQEPLDGESSTHPLLILDEPPVRGESNPQTPSSRAQSPQKLIAQPLKDLPAWLPGQPVKNALYRTTDELPGYCRSERPWARRARQILVSDDAYRVPAEDACSSCKKGMGHACVIRSSESNPKCAKCRSTQHYADCFPKVNPHNLTFQTRSASGTGRPVTKTSLSMPQPAPTEPNISSRSVQSIPKTSLPTTQHPQTEPSNGITQCISPYLGSFPVNGQPSSNFIPSPLSFRQNLPSLQTAGPTPGQFTHRNIPPKPQTPVVNGQLPSRDLEKFRWNQATSEFLGLNTKQKKRKRRNTALQSIDTAQEGSASETNYEFNQSAVSINMGYGGNDIGPIFPRVQEPISSVDNANNVTPMQKPVPQIPTTTSIPEDADSTYIHEHESLRSNGNTSSLEVQNQPSRPFEPQPLSATPGVKADQSQPPNSVGSPEQTGPERSAERRSISERLDSIESRVATMEKTITVGFNSITKLLQRLCEASDESIFLRDYSTALP